MVATDSEDELALSSSALDALKQFYAERDARAEHFAKLHQKAEELHEAATSQDDSEPKLLSMDAFTEDWNESQFWYSDECANFFAKQLLKDATAETKIAVVSAPSVFVQLKNILNAADPSQPKPTIYLLEHDRRFAVFPEFVFYDFAKPTQLPEQLKSSINHLILDPPFLSTDCQTKSALTVSWLLSKEKKPTKLVICTGERMQPLIMKLYKNHGIFTTDFEPVHAKGLANEFYCYANFECLGWKHKEES
ncbi:putative N6-adenine methyltransferase-domain-containing protein [Podospora fimiseda]|uniref:Protein-lysine N-methyltransferase EFM5 n=1 Tax=Podospora fimiseda TaxID=252190 RepID=A0AAN7BRN7_9PEZI|nr:putative N6-adenine methyltransferase-domain-containing protein [Podospora fimiseda]